MTSGWSMKLMIGIFPSGTAELSRIPSPEKKFAGVLGK
jgi:hypothetical protein